MLCAHPWASDVHHQTGIYPLPHDGNSGIWSYLFTIRVIAGICAIYCAESDTQARAEAEEHVHNHFTQALAAFDSNPMSLVPGHMSARGMRIWLESTSGKDGQSLVFTFGEAIRNGTLIVGSP